MIPDHRPTRTPTIWLSPNGDWGVRVSAVRVEHLLRAGWIVADDEPDAYWLTFQGAAALFDELGIPS